MDVSRVMAVANQMITLANELSVITGQTAAKEVETWRTEIGFPKVKVFDGVSVMCYSPINPMWVPSSAAHTFGTQGTTYVQDPSSPLGARSPAGFPMANGHILVFDAAYPNDGEVFDAINASANPVAQDTTGVIPQSELAPGAVDVRTLDLPGLKFVCVFINEALNAGQFIGPVAELHKLSVFMDPSGISDAHAPFANPPQGYEETLGKLSLEQQINKLSDFVWQNYQGPAREALNKNRESHRDPLI